MGTSLSQEVVVEIGPLRLAGTMTVPPAARGLVMFAHGSGSSRHSPRNRTVAARLNDDALGTLLLDLLTREEEDLDRLTAELRFDIPLLTGRLRGAVDWARLNPATSLLPIGLFGASTGGAAALAAAADSSAVRAVVLRGGRPDLAGSALSRVRAPTLMIVGGADLTVLMLNQQACAQMEAQCRLHVVPGATHLFEEPGALDEVSSLAAEWFTRYLTTEADQRR